MRIRVRKITLIAVAAGAAALGALIWGGFALQRAVHVPPPPPPPAVWLERVFAGIKLKQPIYMLEFPDGSGEFAVVERPGRILRVPKGGEAASGVLVNLSERVSTEDFDDGLFSIAFDPHFMENHRFYVFYTALNPRRTVILRLTMDPVSRAAASGSEQVIYEVEHPKDKPVTHHGGTLAFGPDGMLWISTGDAMRKDLSQDLGKPHGKILRIDVQHPAEGKPYGIPADNPFLDQPGALPEIWAYGLRNPWRFSFDAETGAVYTADVGSNKFDEVDRILPRGNYGWPVMEGFECRRAKWFCGQSRFTMPLSAAEHLRDTRNALIGGFVYRGRAIPWLRGKFVFGDYVSGLFAIEVEGDTEPQTSLLRWQDFSATANARRYMIVSSLAEDSERELYAIDYGGAIFKIISLPDARPSGDGSGQR